MKVIDEKGRLFGKINIIDLLVILLVVAAAAFLVVRQVKKADADKTANASGIIAEIRPAYVTFQVRVSGVDPASYGTVCDHVNKSQDLKDQLFSSDANNSMLNAYVTDCEAVPHVTYIATDDGQVKAVKSSGDDDRLDLVFTVEAIVENSTTNLVGLQAVRVGVNHFLKTTHFEFSGYIISSHWDYGAAKTEDA